MRMRRTAFIMALMTVFTVSLFAQNSRGRNYIKQNISEWGGCRNVAITDTGGDLALNGKNDYAYTAGIPQALADALEKYHDDDDYIDDVLQESHLLRARKDSRQPPSKPGTELRD